MVPITTVAAPRKTLGAERVRRYRHDPYGARVLGSLPTENASVTALSCVAPPEYSAVAEKLVKTAMPEVLPIVSSNSPVVYSGIVAFKYGVKRFYAPFYVQVGEAVVTEGDRGEDLGFVQHVEALPSVPAYIGEQVLRKATPEDLQRHYSRAEKEKEALCTMRMLAREVKCSAFIQDIMYQLDDRKITVIIARESRSYVDFRRLQRAAFDVFRCRVWCAYLDEITVPQVGGATATPPPLPPPLAQQQQRPLYGRRSYCSALLSGTCEVSAQA
ncbi:hypothetical protein DQ04_06241010 [Trypanosoma grayi]|uniref:hypothetical protein n=1 Tax=Trypanosoma grayi TaxID=71804 RepID=UPI0004F41AC9|nr:hypothetical protein DQ04_06241010 [Trypanosoma grayi]KEG08890.1 hypothetical protein DQ04_06241010 [Trypanosoma grayi]